MEPALAERLPELRQIVGLRNRVIHGYHDVNAEIVWGVVQNKLLALQARLEDLLGEDEPLCRQQPLALRNVSEVGVRVALRT